MSPSAVDNMSPEWMCSSGYDEVTEEVYHYDDVWAGVWVTSPDGRHMTWGQDSCSGSHTKAEIT